MFICPLCGRSYDSDEFNQRCECGGPLELEHFEGSKKDGIEDKNVWTRYEDFFPFHVQEFSMGEGNTPLLHADRLSKKYGIELFMKNETLNPTWSFKDRGTVMGVAGAKKMDFDSIGTVSTGNMAASVAAYGAHVGLSTKVMVPAHIDERKLKQISVYGAEIRKKEGDYGELYYESLEIGEEEGIYFINSDDPYRVEGYKTIGFELGEKGGIDHVLIPTSSGGLFRGVVKAYEELYESGLIDSLPQFTAVQAEGCSPIHRAFKNGEEVKHWDEPDTVAKAIANPYPPSGDAVVRKLKELDGSCEAVKDEEIKRAQKEIAMEGIYCQPASAVGVAALDKLMGDVIRKGETVASIITGSGMKTV